MYIKITRNHLHFYLSWALLASLCLSVRLYCINFFVFRIDNFNLFKGKTKPSFKGKYLGIKILLLFFKNLLLKTIWSENLKLVLKQPQVVKIWVWSNHDPLGIEFGHNKRIGVYKKEYKQIKIENRPLKNH